MDSEKSCTHFFVPEKMGVEGSMSLCRLPTRMVEIAGEHFTNKEKEVTCYACRHGLK